MIFYLPLPFFRTFQDRVLEHHEGTSNDIACIKACVEKVEKNTNTLLRLNSFGAAMSSAKLAPVPRGLPVSAGWHVARNEVVDKVYEKLCVPDKPWMVGIVGRSGSGKTTAAAAIVGDSPGRVRPFDGETCSQAVQRLSRVRAHFPDGVVWLRVGRGAGSEEQLPSLMLQLARMVHEDIGRTDNYGTLGASPTNGEGGTAYVKKKVATGNGGKGLHCLLVADDVWEPEVVTQLRETGMRVLLTTRNVDLVIGAEGEAVGADRLTLEEAETVLRGAAGIPADARLPHAAHQIIERCDHVAMYIASVGRWENLQRRRDDKAWSKALKSIDDNVKMVVAERDPSDAGDIVEDSHHAILRAGFDCLGGEGINSTLYLCLGVMPDRHSFAACEAAVLLFGPDYAEHDLDTAIEVVKTLERWAIVRVDRTGLYRMHDARRVFARRNLRQRGNVLEKALTHWRGHLSTLDALRSVDLLTLVGLWQAVESMGGDGWRVGRPYDKAVDEMDPTDPSYFASVKMLTSLYQVEGDLAGAEQMMLKVFERNDGRAEANALVVANAVRCRVVITRSRGQVKEAHRLRQRMETLVDPAVERWESCHQTSDLEEVLSLHTLGSPCLTAGRIVEAERWFRRSLDVHKAAGLGDYHAQVWPDRWSG